MIKAELDILEEIERRFSLLASKCEEVSALLHYFAGELYDDSELMELPVGESLYEEISQASQNFSQIREKTRQFQISFSDIPKGYQQIEKKHKKNAEKLNSYLTVLLSQCQTMMNADFSDTIDFSQETEENAQLQKILCAKNEETQTDSLAALTQMLKHTYHFKGVKNAVENKV